MHYGQSLNSARTGWYGVPQPEVVAPLLDGPHCIICQLIFEKIVTIEGFRGRSG